MTVEELRERLRYVTPSAWYGIIDETIAASRAEGAEEERIWLKWYADKMGGAMQELVGRLLSAPKE